MCPQGGSRRRKVGELSFCYGFDYPCRFTIYKRPGQLNCEPIRPADYLLGSNRVHVSNDSDLSSPLLLPPPLFFFGFLLVDRHIGRQIYVQVTIEN